MRAARHQPPRRRAAARGAFPGEPEDAQEEALAFYARHDIARIGTFWLCYMPGTEIVRQGLASGAITTEDVEAMNRGQSTFFYREGNVDDPARRRELMA